MSHNVVILMNDQLAALGLKHLLQENFDVQAIVVSPSADLSLATSENTHYVLTDEHAFVSCLNVMMPRHSRVVVFSPAPEFVSSSVTLVTTSRGVDYIVNQLKRIFTRQDVPASASVLLSQREIDVLRLVAGGCINKEIASQLNISVNTVLTHRKNITAKLGIKSVSGLTFYAMMNGIIAPN